MRKLIATTKTNEQEEFLQMPNGILKNIAYRKITPHWTEVSTFDENGKFCYSETDYSIRKTNKNVYYVKGVRTAGFTIQNNKINIWFGKQIKEMMNLSLFFQTQGFEWISVALFPFITKSMLLKIVTKKLTNELDCFRYYIKTNRYKGMSARLLMKAAYEKSDLRNSLYKFASVSKDYNHMLEFMAKKSWSVLGFGMNASGMTIGDIHDLADQANILEKTIDWKWSEKRMKQEHRKMTEEIMDYEYEMVKDVTFDHVDFEYLPPEMKVIKNAKELYREGQIMQHCIYTNYASSMIQSNYAALHLSVKGEEVTIGLRKSFNGYYFDQAKGVRNAYPSNEARKLIHDLIDKNPKIFPNAEANVEARGTLVFDGVDDQVLINQPF